eukprot:681058-Prorocentrum_minimum.AAC.3
MSPGRTPSRPGAQCRPCRGPRCTPARRKKESEEGRGVSGARRARRGEESKERGGQGEEGARRGGQGEESKERRGVSRARRARRGEESKERGGKGEEGKERRARRGGQGEESKEERGVSRARRARRGEESKERGGQGEEGKERRARRGGQGEESEERRARRGERGEERSQRSEGSERDTTQRANRKGANRGGSVATGCEFNDDGCELNPTHDGLSGVSSRLEVELDAAVGGFSHRQKDTLPATGRLFPIESPAENLRKRSRQRRAPSRGAPKTGGAVSLLSLFRTLLLRSVLRRRFFRGEKSYARAELVPRCGGEARCTLHPSRVNANRVDRKTATRSHLKAVLVAADEAGVATAVAGGAGGHHARLRKHARAAAVAAGEGDRVLVVVGQVEVPAEPALDGGVLAHNLNELLGRHLPSEKKGAPRGAE